jgi:hypothetical protein
MELQLKPAWALPLAELAELFTRAVWQGFEHPSMEYAAPVSLKSTYSYPFNGQGMPCPYKHVGFFVGTRYASSAHS